MTLTFWPLICSRVTQCSVVSIIFEVFYTCPTWVNGRQDRQVRWTSDQGACRRHEPDHAVSSCWERVVDVLVSDVVFLVQANCLLLALRLHEKEWVFKVSTVTPATSKHVTGKGYTQVWDQRHSGGWPNCRHVGHRLQSAGHVTSGRCDHMKLHVILSCVTALCNVQADDCILPVLTARPILCVYQPQQPFLVLCCGYVC